MKRIAVFTVLSILLVCPLAHALPLYYTASGSITVEGVNYGISGSMTVGSELLFHTNTSYGNAGDPIPEGFTPQPGAGQFHYNIHSYSFQIGNKYGLSGIHGSFYVEAVHSLFPGLSDSMWFFDNTQGDWSYWWGHIFRQYDASGLERPRTWYGYNTLAPMINLSIPNANATGPQINASNIWLVQSPAPVPEPATLLLLTGGIGIIAGLKKRSRLKYK